MGISAIPENLTVGNFPEVLKKIVVTSGLSLTRGTVVAKVADKMVACDTTGSSGVEIPYAVLAQDVDATAADTESMVYLTGAFNRDALTITGDLTTVEDALRQLSIYVE